MELALIVKLRLSIILIRHKSNIICVKKLYLLRSACGVVAEHGPHGVPLGCLASGPPAARRTRGPCGAPVRRLSPYARLGPCVRGDVRDRLSAPR